jgi:pimeloyl-ACP methyl ester carboxylesterase
LDVLAGVGHLPEAEVPDLYAQKVAEFLSA